MRNHSFTCLALFIGLSSPALADIKYCVPVNKIELNPFRPIHDGKDLAYLMLLKSYISTDADVPGLLRRYEFSPDGKTFTAELDERSKWPDGSDLTSVEAAVGIARGLLFRPIGERVEVVGARQAKESPWSSGKISGIEILDARKFKLKLESKIENLTGTLREALSTNCRQNRLWPVQRNLSQTPNVIGKMKVESARGQIQSSAGDVKIRWVDKSGCSKSDLFLYPEVTDEALENFAIARSPMPQSVLLQVNSGTLKLAQRKALIEWIRAAFTKASPQMGIEPVASFYQQGESGYRSGFSWRSDFNSSALQGHELSIGYYIPSFRILLEAAAEKAGVKLRFVQLPAPGVVVDAQFESSGIQNGRHTIFQDLLKSQNTEAMLANTPLTKTALMAIERKSAATIPPDAVTLQSFEEASFKEQTIAPIARRYLLGFSRKSAPVQLTWEKSGELAFATVPSKRETK